MNKPIKNKLLAAVDAGTSDKVSQETPVSETSKPKPEPIAVKQKSREHTKNVSAQLHPKFGKELKIIAAEEETTVQELMEEALTLLFIKKARKNFIN